MDDLLSDYISYCQPTEVPAVFNRWSMMTCLGAALGRNFTFPFGHAKLKPNLYVMLMGVAGTRKSTAVKTAKKLLEASGYNTFAAERTSKEQFLMDLAGDGAPLVDPEGEVQWNVLGSSDEPEDSKAPADMMVAADEFNDFIGQGNMEFISLLGTLWDHEGPYKSRFKRAASSIIHDPVVSILSGNTPTNFAMAFPVETIGQGFFSRLILVHAEKTSRKFTFPKSPSDHEKHEFLNKLHRARQSCMGSVEMTHGAELLLDKIYKKWVPFDDVRFDSYANRRFTHLLKVCLVVCGSTYSKVLDERKVIYANTILHAAEHFMPQALGEFGKARNSDVAQKLMQAITTAAAKGGILTFAEAWKQLQQDLDKQEQMTDLVNKLMKAGKVQVANGGLLPIKQSVISCSAGEYDFSLLSHEEQHTLGLF